MVLKSAIAGCVLLLCQVACCDESTDTNLTKKVPALSIVAGCGILALEVIGLPMLDFKYNYRSFPPLRNPFLFVCEKEPYIQDELWHFVGASMLTEINYKVFQEYFGIQNPYIITGLLTITFWSGMECCDALCGSGFSVRDEVGNVLGTAFTLVNMRYPDFPVKVRVGIKNIRRFNDAISKSVSGSIHHQLGKQYDYMKVELIYVVPDLFLYTGLAISRTGNKEDQFGITAGFDALDYLNSLHDGWWNKTLAFTSRYFSTSVSLTWWLN